MREEERRRRWPVVSVINRYHHSTDGRVRLLLCSEVITSSPRSLYRPVNLVTRILSRRAQLKICWLNDIGVKDDSIAVYDMNTAVLVFY